MYIYTQNHKKKKHRGAKDCVFAARQAEQSLHVCVPLPARHSLTRAQRSDHGLACVCGHRRGEVLVVSSSVASLCRRLNQKIQTLFGDVE